MHAARIFRHIAADGAGDLRRRIGRVIKAGGLHRLRHCKIGDAGLHHRDAVVVVDLANAVELRKAEQHAVAERQGAARERGAGAARHDLDALAVAETEHSRHLLGGLRQYHDHWQLTIGGQAVALERPHRRFGVDHALAGHNALEPCDDLGAALKDGGIGLRHHKRHRILQALQPAL